MLQEEKCSDFLFVFIEKKLVINIVIENFKVLRERCHLDSSNMSDY